jgi:hypothetical protein
MAAINLTTGDKTALYFAVLDPFTRAADPFVVPSPFNITTSELFASEATTISVNALPGPIPAGIEIEIKLSTLSPAASVTICTSKPSPAGATVLTVLPTSAGLGAAATGSYVPKLLLDGRATINCENYGRNSQSYGAYASGAITSASWTVDYTFTRSDPAFYRLSSAAHCAAYCYLWWDDDPITGRGIAGIVQLDGFPKPVLRNGIENFTIRFLGRGTPTRTPEVA